MPHRCPLDTPKLFDCTPDPCTAWFAESKADADWTIGLAGTESQFCARAFSTSAHRSVVNVGSSSMISRIRVRQADSIAARTVSSPAAATNSPRDASSLFSTDLAGAPARPNIRTKPCFIHDHASVAIAVTSADDAALIRSSTTAPSIPSRTVSAFKYGSPASDSSRSRASPHLFAPIDAALGESGNRLGGRYGRHGVTSSSLPSPATCCLPGRGPSKARTRYPSAVPLKVGPSSWSRLGHYAAVGHLAPARTCSPRPLPEACYRR